MDFHKRVWQCPIGALFEDVVERGTSQVGEKQWPTASAPATPDFRSLPLTASALRYDPHGKAESAGLARVPPALRSVATLTASVVPSDTGHQEGHARAPKTSQPVPQHDGVQPRLAGSFSDGKSQHLLRHENGHCKPCVFWYYAKCLHGASCKYCHMEHQSSEYKALRLSRVTRHKLRDRRQQQTNSHGPPSVNHTSPTFWP